MNRRVPEHKAKLQGRIIDALVTVYEREQRAPHLNEVFRVMFPHNLGNPRNHSSCMASLMASAFGEHCRDNRGGKREAYLAANVPYPPMGRKRKRIA